MRRVGILVGGMGRMVVVIIREGDCNVSVFGCLLVVVVVLVWHDLFL